MSDAFSWVASLVVVGYVLLLLEFLIIPGFGVAGVSGIVSIVAAIYLAVTRLGGTTGPATVVAILVATTALMTLLSRSRVGRRLVHETSLAGAKSAPPIAAVGERGIAETDLRPAGIAVIDTRRLSVVTVGDYVAAGTQVAVVQVEGGRIVVEPEA